VAKYQSIWRVLRSLPPLGDKDFAVYVLLEIVRGIFTVLESKDAALAGSEQLSHFLCRVLARKKDGAILASLRLILVEADNDLFEAVEILEVSCDLKRCASC